MNRKDTLYQQELPVSRFVFDERVVAVFNDMIKRSVPGYGSIVSMIGIFAERYAQAGTNLYDLGSSLGAATLLMRRQVKLPDCRIIAVDNSPAMIERSRTVLEADEAAERKAGRDVLPVELICDDILNLKLENASVVVLNFTLQFIPLDQRAELIRTVHQALVPGGLLILSEKIRKQDDDMNQLFIDLHHRFKEENGYSRLEISRKRAALETVLIPETLEEHDERLRDAGFATTDVWFQCVNFASMMAVKTG